MRYSVCLTVLWLAMPGATAQTLEHRLLNESPTDLARDARASGDAGRGAIVFHQPLMACAHCHPNHGNTRTGTLGPSLTVWQVHPADEDFVEAVLRPSRSIRKGYEAVQVLTSNGRVITGLLDSESADVLTLRDPSSGRRIPIPADNVDERQATSTSIMPAGQVNQLTSRQQFLDLLRYLFEIRDGGVQRAQELQPPPGMFALRLPEYEKHVDHAGLIGELDDQARERGEVIYNRLCINCHGDHAKPGSLPTALRFAEGRFQNGSDPHSMYRTLTHGFGFMVPQTWMVPRQKYDVVHYIREAYVRQRNRSQYFDVTSEYLTRLPQGNTRGPEPAGLEPWAMMDYGPRLINTYEIGNDGSNFAYKGIAVRLDAGPGGVGRGSAWMIFDHDTMRMAAVWTGTDDRPGENFIDWNGIHFNDRHQVHPRIVGDVHVSSATGPGWANPANGSFADDSRVRGRDNRRYGPLPAPWAKYQGLAAHGEQTLIHYSVGSTSIVELPGLAPVPASGAGQAEPMVFTRTFNIGPRDRRLTLLVGNLTEGASIENIDDRTIQCSTPVGAGETQGLIAGLSVRPEGAGWSLIDGRLCLSLPAGNSPLRFILWFAAIDAAAAQAPDPWFEEAAPDLGSVKSGPQMWTQQVISSVQVGDDHGAFAVDALTPPENNPWLARTRLTGLDFFDDPDRMAVCSWDGDVWVVSGLTGLQSSQTLRWQRIASGLFQPLGLKIIDGQILVTCRDQIAVLHDLNGDGETDFYECFNNDHQVTAHFHEFAMGLQADDEGNLYYAKSARHALPAVVPHHGTLLRVSSDGQQTDVLATGFRAANGVCLNPDGSFVVTDQEGHWNPKNRINWVREGEFYGNMLGWHDVTDSSDEAMELPLCWITNEFDRSPGELLWVDSPSWGPLNGALLNLSYGYGRVYVVPSEEVDGQRQGGMCAFPIPRFPTGVMRGRFHPVDGHLYVCGMFAWAGNQQHPGGLYRVRATGRAAHLPIALRTHSDGLTIEFTDELDRSSAEDPDSFQIRVWSLKRTANYGSDHYDEHSLKVTNAVLSATSRSVRVTIPEIAPTWCMEIHCRLETTDGRSIERVIHNTIHALNEP